MYKIRYIFLIFKLEWSNYQFLIIILITINFSKYIWEREKENS